MIAPEPEPLLISVVIVNYNGHQWMERCLRSLAEQTIFDRIEIIVSDNDSSDGSDQEAAQWLAARGKGQVVRNGANLGFCEANNIGARLARGQFLLFLNADAWLEPNCLEKLCQEMQRTSADAGTPLVVDYDDDSFQSSGAAGLDFFGIPNSMKNVSQTTEIFAAPGCSLLVRKSVFEKVGGFAAELFMYAEETDLSWRIWLAGGRIVVVPAATAHHRGAVTANPEGETKIVESRTNETKRYYTNRNGILLLLKNCQHALLLLLLPHLLLLAAEALVGLCLVRRWSYVSRCYIEAVAACWRMRGQVRTWRRFIRTFRQRGDWWMLRFLHWRPNRWPEIKRLFCFGFPQVDRR